jgi:hypothetical protein
MTRVTTSPREVTAIVTMEIKSEAGWILDIYELIGRSKSMVNCVATKVVSIAKIITTVTN